MVALCPAKVQHLIINSENVCESGRQTKMHCIDLKRGSYSKIILKRATKTPILLDLMFKVILHTMTEYQYRNLV